jgi:hypothetical protein
LLRHDQDAFEHLLAICRLGRGNYFVFELGTLPGEATDNFLRSWLLERLSPYFDVTPDVIHSAADRGEFRHLGNAARSAVIDRIRRRKASKDALDRYRSEHERLAGALPKVVSMDVQITADEAHCLRRDMLATSKDAVYPSSLGNFPAVWPSELTRLLESNELEHGLGPQPYRVLLAICDRFPDRLSVKGDAVRVIAASEQVSEQTARRLLSDLQTKMADLRRADPAVQALHELLTRPKRRACFFANNNILD